MASKAPRCAAGNCYEKATQRICTDTMIKHRCDKHRVSDEKAAAHGWRLFDIDGPHIIKVS